MSLGLGSLQSKVSPSVIRWLKLATVAIKTILHFNWVQPGIQEKRKNTNTNR